MTKYLDTSTLTKYTSGNNKGHFYWKVGDSMAKGYIVANGYMGYVSEYEKYLLFATEQDYLEYIA